MANGFDLRRYQSWDELLYRASLELSPNDLIYILKFGRSANLSANTAEDVWSTGGIKALPYTPGETLSVVSASASDTAAGTGARAVLLSGLDTDYNTLNEVVTMNGVTPVVTSSSFITINRARVVSSGTGQMNAGNITVTGSTTANVVATIPAGDSTTQQSHFTIPAGYTAFTANVVLSVYRGSTGTGARSAEVDQMAYVPSIDTTYRTLRYGVRSDGGPFVSNNPLLSQTPEKTTLWFEGTADANNTVITSSVGYVMIRGDFNYITEI